MTGNFIFWLASFLFVAVAAEGNQSGRVSHVGILGNVPTERIDAFRGKLRELGWVENVTIVIHKTNPPRGIDVWSVIAAEFVRQKVDVIVAVSTEPALAAQQVSKIIPIVMAGGADPVEWRLVESLARPGGNVTGVRTLQAELGGKRLELLRDTFPKIARVAIPWNPNSRGQQPQMKEAWAAARLLGVQIEPIEIKSPDDYRSAFAVMKKERVDAFVPLSSPRSAIYRYQIVELALSHKLPAIYPGPEFAEAGGLMSYGPNRVETYQRAAVYVDKILRGAKPAELPVEQPTKFEFVINLKAAKQIGVTIPSAVLMDADRVIK